MIMRVTVVKLPDRTLRRYIEFPNFYIIWMHRCLETQELIVSIFSEVADLGDESGYASLAALARTCQAFKNPALDALWRTQDGLRPLVNLFPAKGEGDQEVCLQLLMLHCLSLKLSKPPQISMSEWFRIVPYASRVKVFMLDGDPEGALPHVWHALAMSRPDSTSFLFPNLQHLSWVGDETRTSFIRLVLPPTLIRLELVVWLASEEVTSSTGSILRSLGHFCSSLQEFSLRGDHDIPWRLSFMNALSQWVNLRRLTLDRPPSPAAFGYMNRLEYLHISSNSEEPEKLNTPVVLPTLRELKFEGNQLNWVTSFLSSIQSSCHLETVDIEVNLYEEPVLHPWTKLLKVLGCCNSHTLTSLSVTIADSDYVYPGQDHHHQKCYPNQEAISPLLALSNLIHLKLRPYLGFDIDDEVLRQMSLAFPHLRSLELGRLTLPWTVSSRITLVGLIPLIVNCPQLHHLGIIIDATTIPDTCIPTSIPNTILKTLEVGRSRISSPVDVAAFLMDLFPNVTRIVHGWDYPWGGLSGNESEAWDIVGLCMEKFRPRGR